MTITASESCSNIRTVKAFSNEEEESRKFRIDSLKVLEQGKKKALMTGSQQMLSQIFLYFTLALILYVSKLMFERNKLKIGNISTFMLYILGLIWQFQLIAWGIP